MLFQDCFCITNKEYLMQALILIIGEQGSEKDSIYEAINGYKIEQTIFKDIQVKQLFNKTRIPDLLLINFPELQNIHQEIPALLTLSKHLRIIQIIICLNYHKKILEIVKKIKNKIISCLSYSDSQFFTFYINNSPNFSFDNKSKVIFFQKVKDLQKDSIKIINDGVLQYSEMHGSNQYNNLKKYQPDNVKLMNDIANGFKKQYDQFLQQQLNDPKNLHIVLQDNNQELKSLYENLKIQVSYQIDTPISQFYCDLLHLLFFLEFNNDENISIDTQQNKQLKNLYYCYNCSTIYQKFENKLYQCSLQLFKFQRSEFKARNLTKCYICNLQLSQYLGQMLKFIRQIFYLKFIDEYYFENLTIFKKHFEDNGQQIQVQKIVQQSINQNLNIQPEQHENDLEQGQDIKQSLKILLLSNEDDEKSKIFQKVCKNYSYDEKTQFTTGNILCNLFHLVDTPLFSFEGDEEQKELLYTEYLKRNAVHYIFFCIQYQRTGIMKERVLKMLINFPNVNQAQMGLLISIKNEINNNENFDEDENEIIRSMQGILKNVIIITNKDDRNNIINKISNCVQKIQITQELSFKDTIFNNEDDEEVQNSIQKQLQQMTDQVENNYKQSQENEIQQYQTKKQLLLEKKKEYEENKEAVKIKYQENINELQEKIKLYQQQIWNCQQQRNSELEYLKSEESKIDSQLKFIDGKLQDYFQDNLHSEKNQKKKSQRKRKR